MRRRSCWISCYLLVLIFIGITSSVAAKSSSEIRLSNTEKIVNVSDDTVKFLFKTNNGAHVRLFLGETLKSLNLIKDVGGYDDSEGLMIDELVSGKKYFYRIVVEYKKEIFSSTIISFYKYSNKIIILNNM